MPMIIDGSNGLTFPDNSRQYMGFFGFKNRIINGDMRIDQRSAGASSTAGNGTYTTCDRWMTYSSQASKFTVQRNAGSVTPPAGFTNYLGATSSSAHSLVAGDYFSINQVIEGFNVADLGWGTASAQAITISFWARSSLTGTFGGSLGNSAQNRSYPFTYTISAANTWEQKTITVPGDTSGTWLTNNGAGIQLNFGLGVGSTFSSTAGAWAAGNFVSATGATSVVGTNGATFQITGVQLEEGVTATNFDYRPYGTELSLCQRYYFKTYAQDVVPGTASTSGAPGRLTDAAQNYASIQVFFPVTMRAAPTITIFNPTTGAAASMRGDAANFAATTSATFNGVQNATVYANNVSISASTGIHAHVTAAIEL